VEKERGVIGRGEQVKELEKGSGGQKRTEGGVTLWELELGTGGKSGDGKGLVKDAITSDGKGGRKLPLAVWRGVSLSVLTRKKGGGKDLLLEAIAPSFRKKERKSKEDQGGTYPGGRVNQKGSRLLLRKGGGYVVLLKNGPQKDRVIIGRREGEGAPTIRPGVGVR